MKFFLLSIPLLVLLSSCDAADFRDVKSASLKLKQGMTEAQAINVIGFEPDSAELDTCGAKTKKGEWTCRTLTFSGLYDDDLIITEALAGKVWRINNWSVR
jgi:hypothetical protein